jgi:hypothetical protein
LSSTWAHPGQDGPDTIEAAATAEKTRIYPLGLIERDRPAMKFPNGSNIRVNMMYPTDFTYWEKLKKFIDYKPAVALLLIDNNFYMHRVCNVML